MARQSARPPRRTWSRPAVLAAGVAVLVAVGVAIFLLRRPAPPRSADLADLVRPGAASGFNLVLVTLDTVRADRLGPYGYETAVTPTLEGLLGHGIQFDQAVTPVPITLPAHASMMTGLVPPRHGVRDNGVYRLGPEHGTLAERLKEHGYDTAAFIGCFVLDARFGLAQGFDTYDFAVGANGFFPSNFDFNQRSAADVTDAAIRWLDGRPATDGTRPFFLWAHYFDAHVPYQSPLAADPRFAGRPYDAEIAYIDQELGRLLARIEQQGLEDRTLVAVVSDHGEGLGDHGEDTHGLFVYESTLRVAFVLSSPGLFRGTARVTDRAVSLVDLRPTLEDLLGLSPPETPFDGASLLAGGAPEDRPLYIETMMPFHMARCSPLFGIRRLHAKYIESPIPEYYDLRADPEERRNLWSSRPDDRRALERALAELRSAWPEGASEVTAREMTAEEAERLRSLGYVHAQAMPSTELPDVKSMVGSGGHLSRALQLRKANRLVEALEAAREAVAEHPGYLDAAALLAQLCQQTGRTDEAIDVLKEQLEVNPTAAAALQLAQAYLAAGKVEEMEVALATAARIEPDNGFVHMLRGDRLNRAGRTADAVREYEEAIRIDPHRTGSIVGPVLDRLRNRLVPAAPGGDGAPPEEGGA